METYKAQELSDRNAEVDALNVQLISLQKKADGTEYVRNRVKAHLPELQCGQQRNQAALSWVQSEISTLGTASVQDRKYSVNRL